MLRIGEMKAGKPLRELLERSPPECSPPEFAAYFDHCRCLAFDVEPDYGLLKTIFAERMEQEGWNNDGQFDWVVGHSLEKGTIILDEYRVDEKFVDSDQARFW